MSQDLIAISRAGFKVQLPVFEDAALYETIAKIRAWRKLHGAEVTKKVAHDVVVKERMLLGEICRRSGLIGDGAEKFLIAVPDDVLRTSASELSLGELKNLYYRAILWKRRNGDKAANELFGMVLRKEAIIHREMTRRGYTELDEFRAWKSNLQRNLTKDGRIGQRRAKTK